MGNSNASNWCCRWLLLILAIGAAIVPATASRRPIEIAPSEFTSPDRKWVLFVDPSTREGEGPGQYRMSLEGSVVWEGERPWTMQNPILTKDGRVVAHAYDRGHDGRGMQFRGMYGYGDTILLILDERGNSLLEERLTRRFNRILHSDPTPVLFDMQIDEPGNRAMFWLGAEFFHEESEVRLYTLSTGEHVRTVIPRPIGRPSKEQEVQLYEVRLLPESDLLAVRWKEGFLGRLPIRWSFVRPGDGFPVYTIGEHDLQDGTPPADAVELILAESKEEVRTVRFLATGENMRLWDLGTGPAPTDAPPTPPAKLLPEIPTHTLEPLGEWTMDGATRELHPEIVDFAFNEAGEILTLTQMDHSTSTTLRRMTQEGRVLGEQLLPLPIGRYRIATAPGGEEVLFFGGRRGNAPSTVYIMPVGEASPQPVTLGEHDILDLAPFGEDLLVLARYRSQYTMWEHLIRCRRDGTAVWTIEEARNREDTGVFSPEGIAVSKSGEIAVVDNIRKNLQLYSADGAYLRTISLEGPWGRRPNYPTEVFPVADGWIVRDFNGTAPWVWTSTAGDAARDILPRQTDGIVFEGHLRQAPGGALWIAKGPRLMRLGTNDTVDSTIGPPMTSEAPDEIGSLSAAPDGFIYAMDRRTKEVFVYTLEGKLARRLSPAPEDFGERDRDQLVTADREGNVWITNEIGLGRDGGLRFDPQGNRIGFVSLPDGTRDGRWHARPGGAWVLAYGETHRVDTQGNILNTITRRPDNQWVKPTVRATVAPDGSIALLDEGAMLLYDPEGKPVAQVPLPEFCFAAAHRGDLVVAVGREIHAYDATGRPLWKSTDSGKEWAGVPMLPAGANELWLWDKRGAVVRRHTLPRQ